MSSSRVNLLTEMYAGEVHADVQVSGTKGRDNQVLAEATHCWKEQVGAVGANYSPRELNSQAARFVRPYEKACLQEEICAEVASGRPAGHGQVGLECHKASHAVRAHSEADGVRRSQGKAPERHVWRWYKRSCGTWLAQQHGLRGVQRVLPWHRKS